MSKEKKISGKELSSEIMSEVGEEASSQNKSKQATGAIPRRNTPGRRGPMSHGQGVMLPGEKPKDLKATLFKMFRFMGRFKLLLVVVFVFAIGSTVFNIIGPKVLSTATTELFNGIAAKIAHTGDINFEKVAGVLIFTMVLYGVSALCSFIQAWVMSFISQRTSYTMRQQLEAKIDRMPMGYFEQSSVGDTLSRITNDVDTLGQSLNQGITQLITSLTTIIGVLVMMLTINPLMTLVTVVMLPVSVVLIMIVVKRSQKYFFAQQETLGAINGQVEETFSGHAIVKAFGQEKATVNIFNKTNAKLYESAWKSQFISGLMMPVMSFVSNLGYVVVAILGSYFAISGLITVGDIQAFIQYVKNFTQPITQLTQVSNVLQAMAAAAERVFEFLEAPEEEIIAASIVSDDVSSDVEFDHVKFGYSGDKIVIRDFSAKIKAGQTVALVGPTGAGKTTMMKLLMRFYDVNAGVVRIGGHDVRAFERTDLRSMFGMVLQDTWLFKGSIRDNIRYGRLSATDAEVEEAAKAAYIHHFIQTLPGGYDMEINEDASNISTGQRQLLTIARAILADRRMLILDEATSSVDTRTEERIQKAMDNLMKGRTSFVIAHRLSTIREADLILVMRDGDIVEQGTHRQLMESGGFYSELYGSQFANCIDEIEE